MDRDEAEEQTLIYVDMLGFADLTEKHPRRIETDQQLSTCDRTVVSTAATQTQFNLFNRVLDCCIDDQPRHGGITAMLFSDCAFLNLGYSLRAAPLATDLMREFIKAGVPVRMGIGKGTFYSFGYSTDAGADSMLVSKSRFIGTAVVRAHDAEKCGGKGMRIFVHPEVDDLDNNHSDFRILNLPLPYEDANRELDYLHPEENQQAGQEDRNLFQAVNDMVSAVKEGKNECEWDDIKIQYDHTRSALNRMRESRSRAPFG